MRNTYRPREAETKMDLTVYQAGVAMMQFAGVIGAVGLVCVLIARMM
jgi:hypothetical protein